MHAGVIRSTGFNIGNRRLIEAQMKGCQVRDLIIGERDMSMWEIKETLQWQPMGNQLVVSTLQQFPVLLFSCVLVRN